jgi:hypothetical protein
MEQQEYKWTGRPDYMPFLKQQVIIFAFSVMLTNCGSEFYSRKELKSQKIPDELRNRIWTLVEVNSAKILDSSQTAEFNRTKGTNNCRFTFQFGDKGELLMTFKNYKFKGTYLISGDSFKYIDCGYNMKIVWTGDPECKITPMDLSYVFGGPMQFRIDGQTLTMNNNVGNSFKLSIIN